MDQPKIEGQKLAEFMKSLKGQWSLLNESEKLMYRQKADDLQEKYKEELDKWESQMIQEGNTEFVRRNILKKKLSDPNKKKSVSKTKSTESPSTDGKETKNEQEFSVFAQHALPEGEDKLFHIETDYLNEKISTRENKNVKYNSKTDSNNFVSSDTRAENSSKEFVEQNENDSKSQQKGFLNKFKSIFRK